MIFDNRMHAGKLLAEKLAQYAHASQAVIGLARGGAVVAAPIAQLLHIPPGILVVKKIKSPEDAELAVGAVAPDRVSYVDWKLATRLGIDEAYVNRQIADLSESIKIQDQFYRKFIPHIALEGKRVIVTDDGAATGATIKAAVRWFRTKKVANIFLALPVASAPAVRSIGNMADDVIVLERSADLGSVGQYFREFAQVDETEIMEIFQKKGPSL